MKLIQYGGAVFSGNCQQCGSVAKTPKNLSVNRFMDEHANSEPHTILGRCKEHGRVKLPFVGFGS